MLAKLTPASVFCRVCHGFRFMRLDDYFCHGFRFMRLDDYFLVNFDHF